MRLMKLFAGLFALVFATTALPAAAQTVTATPSSIAAALQRAGLSAKINAPDDGSAPYIESTTNGTAFAVFLLNCTNGKNCSTVQFFAGFPDNKATLSSINQWNTDNRFGRAYISDKGSARVEMDVDLDAAGGMSAALFADNLSVWVAVVAKYKAAFSK